MLRFGKNNKSKRSALSDLSNIIDNERRHVKAKRDVNNVDAMDVDEEPIQPVSNGGAVGAIEARPSSGSSIVTKPNQNDNISSSNIKEENILMTDNNDANTKKTQHLSVNYIQEMETDIQVVDMMTMKRSLDLVDDYVFDIYQNLLYKQYQVPIRPDFLTLQCDDINPHMRTILVDWLVEVCDEYLLCQHTLFLAVNIVDRFIQKQKVHRSKLQLVGIAAVLIASKLYELQPPTCKELVYIAANTYTKPQLLVMERLILKRLGFYVSAPIAIEFLDLFFATNLYSVSATHRVHATFLLEMFLQTLQYRNFSPSVIAAAAIYVSQRTLTIPVTCFFEDPEQVKKCAITMNAIYVNIKNRSKKKCKAVIEKYERVKQFKVASITPRPCI